MAKTAINPPGNRSPDLITRHPLRRNYFPHIGCIFVHVPKTGGTSVSAYLLAIDRALAERGVPRRFGRPPSGNKHYTARQHRSKYPEIWASAAFRFCVVRNPFEQIVSSYHWWLQRELSEEHKSIGAGIIANSVRRGGSFEKFVRHGAGKNLLNEYRGNPEDWFLDEEGQDLVDFIIRAERMEELADRLAERGIAVPPGVAIPRLNVTERDHYSICYTATARESVSSRFKYLIDRFGYAFEEPP